MSAETRRPRAPIRAGVGKAGFIATTLAAALGAIMAAAPSAVAQLQPSSLAGRWTQAPAGSKQHLTFDLVPCGQGWCGIEVTNGKDCGPVAIRLDAGAVQERSIEFLGRYERTPGTAPYTVSALLHSAAQRDAANADAELRLILRGNTGGSFEPFRRTFPLHMVLRREGDPTCRADPKLS